MRSFATTGRATNFAALHHDEYATNAQRRLSKLFKQLLDEAARDGAVRHDIPIDD